MDDTCDAEGCDRRAEYHRLGVGDDEEWHRCANCRP